MDYRSLRTNSTITKECPFCYSYTRPGNINPCCTQNVCLSTSSISCVVNNNTRTKERSLLLGNQIQGYIANYSTATTSTLQYTTLNNAAITSTIYGQLDEVRRARYQPYQPYIPAVIPPSVMELEMRTANVGVPHSFFTMADCKGNQSVTTTNVVYN